MRGSHQLRQEVCKQITTADGWEVTEKAADHEGSLQSLKELQNASVFTFMKGVKELLMNEFFAMKLSRRLGRVIEYGLKYMG